MTRLLIHDIAELVTPRDDGPRVGADQGAIERRHQVDLVAEDGRIIWIGPSDERRSAVGDDDSFDVRVDGAGCTAIPGLVDCHTHLPWAGSRESEFAQRLEGRSYLEIAAAGGGILSTVAATRAATEDQLVENTRTRLDRMLAHGTTTVEIKSGYGLNLDDELKQLRAAHRAASESPCDVVTTLMAAHEFPPEYRDDRDAWVDEIVDRIIPAAAHLATFCDVFCERGVFTVEQSRRVLEAGRSHGLVPRLHADEFVDSGAALLAAELGARSADHVAAVTAEGIDAMAGAGVTAVLLPGVNFFLMKETLAPARAMIDAGVAVALATDCNPGSSHTESLFFIIQLAIFQLRMSIEECLTAVTLHPARVLGRDRDVGSLELGKQADVALLSRLNLLHVGYHLGLNPVKTVVKAGRVVHEA